MNHAPNAPFLGSYLQAAIVNWNDKMTNGGQQNMVRQRNSKVLRELRRRMMCLMAWQRHVTPEAAAH